MVGVPKSKGCSICIRRKIKCDESWPACGNCQKSRFDCPGKSDRFRKFVDEGPRQRNGSRQSPPDGRESETALPERSTAASYETVWTAGEAHAVRNAFEHVSTARTKSGARFDKWRVEQPDQLRKRRTRGPGGRQSLSSTSTDWPVPYMNSRGPGSPSKFSFTKLDTLRNTLIYTIQVAKPGYQVIFWGPFLRQLPQRLGTPVLDNAAALFASTCCALLDTTRQDKVDPPLYGKALRSLREGIENVGKDWRSVLCASLLFAITEATAVGGTGTNRNFITHIGGAADILRQVGPSAFSEASSFERALLRSCTVGINMNAVFFDKGDLLAEPQWAEHAFNSTGLEEPWISKTRVSEAMSHLPGLCRDIRALSSPTAYPSRSNRKTCAVGRNQNDIYGCLNGAAAPSSTPNLVETINNARNLRSILDSTRPYLESAIFDPAITTRLPSSDPIFPTALSFSDLPHAWVLWFYWGMSIITNKILVSLYRRTVDDNGFPEPEREYLEDLERESVRMAHLIVQSVDYALMHRPIGTLYIDIALVMAFRTLSEAEDMELDLGGSGAGNGDGDGFGVDDFAAFGSGFDDDIAYAGAAYTDFSGWGSSPSMSTTSAASASASSTATASSAAFVTRRQAVRTSILNKLNSLHNCEIAGEEGVRWTEERMDRLGGWLIGEGIVGGSEGPGSGLVGRKDEVVDAALRNVGKGGIRGWLRLPPNGLVVEWPRPSAGDGR